MVNVRKDNNGIPAVNDKPAAAMLRTDISFSKNCLRTKQATDPIATKNPSITNALTAPSVPSGSISF